MNKAITKQRAENRIWISLDPWFVTGFSEGEGAFTFSRSGDAFALYFAITQREDSRSILEMIQKYFNGIGNIYTKKESLPTRNSGHTKSAAYYRVCKQNELLKIIEHFDKFPLQTKKQDVYRIWREMALEKTRNYINCKSEKFSDFAEKMVFLNQKSRAFKKHSK